MRAGGGDLQGALGGGLPADVGEVGAHGRLGGWRSRRRRGQRRGALEMVDAGAQRGRAHHLEALDQAGLGGVALGHHQPPHPRGAQAPGHGKDPGHRAQRAVERELTEQRRAREAEAAPLAGEHRGGDGEVEAGALLGQLRGGEVDGQLPRREVEPGVAHGRLDPHPRLLDGAIGQADDGEPRQAAADVGLHRDGHAGDAVDGAAYRARSHTSQDIILICGVATAVRQR